MGPFQGGPPITPSHPSPLLVVQFRRFCFVSAWFSIYLFLRSCVALCGTWYTESSVLMCFRELCSTPIMLVFNPYTPTHKPTETYSGGSDGVVEGV